MKNFKTEKNITGSHIILAAGLPVLFGANFTAVKVSFEGFGVFTSASLRLFIASIAIFLWAKVFGKSLKIEKKYFKKIFIWTSIFILEYSLLFWGISKTNASRAALIINLQPFFVLILARFVSKSEKIIRHYYRFLRSFTFIYF